MTYEKYKDLTFKLEAFENSLKLLKPYYLQMKKSRELGVKGDSERDGDLEENYLNAEKRVKAVKQAIDDLLS